VLRISLEERKDFISKIATKVFSETGYQASSLQDISRKAEISKAGLYHYFKSKEEILAYTLIRNSDIFLEELKEKIKKNRKAGLTPQESFKGLIRTYARHVNSDKDKRLIVLRERHQLSSRYKKELFKREQAMFRLLRTELKKIPDLEKDIDENVITFLIISMSHWLGYWYRETERLNLDQIIDQNIRVIFDGMLKR
jgi:AcrR family transcriptional regulator